MKTPRAARLRLPFAGLTTPSWAAVLLLCGCAARPPRVIVTTDIGTETDDQWAVAYLALLHEAGAIDLRAIVTTHAPSFPAPAAEGSAAAARETLAALDLHRPPAVIAGESTPLASKARSRGGPGARRIADEARLGTGEDRLRVLSIGAATDVAEALLLDPSIAGRVEIIAMAFEGWPRGGDPYNVKNDPRAFEVIFDSEAPLVIGAADLCLRHLTLDREAAARWTAGGRRGGDYLRNRFEQWLDAQPDLCREWTGRDAWPIWDLVTAAYLVGLAASGERPRPRIREDLTFDHAAARGKLRWITSLDEKRLWEDFRARLARGRVARND